jgi:hypothetical protein
MAPANDGRHRLGHVHPYVAAYQIIGQEPYDNFVVHVSNHFTINPDRTITAMAYHFRVSCGSPQALTVMPANAGGRVAFPNTRTPRLATSTGNECGRLHRRLRGQQSGRSQRPGNQSVHMLTGGGASNPARAFTPDVGTSGLDATSLIHPDVVHT